MSSENWGSQNSTCWGGCGIGPEIKKIKMTKPEKY